MPAKTPTKLQVLRPPPAVVAETIEIEVEHCGAEKTATLKKQKKTWPIGSFRDVAQLMEKILHHLRCPKRS